ncbi:tyrosine-type recombinase/integrase [Niallia circulans]|uniref:tyrosine-type recombinase/integrase n=1 Tax=Niallia circulans TaxID=1397 RepID=UPI002E2236A0|nr:tyrosine-type recombinase/integrase [Niallia circulans]MED5103150.1 tyrosine-type recombinase/integrase [Niallia circulans]
MLFEDVLEEYLYHCMAKGYTAKTMKNKRQEYKQLKIYLHEKRGITELESITVFDLRAYVRLKQKDGLQPQSVVTMFKMIKAFFSWCEQEGYLKENIASKVELPKVPIKILNGFTTKEVQSMIDAFSYKNYLECRNKAIIAMLADTGLRAMEVRGLKQKNVMETSILVNGKGNKERMVFISPALKRILIKYERMRSEYFKDVETVDNYFLNYTGGSISHVALDAVVKKAGERAGVEKKRVSPHTFRHFFSVESLKAGIDIYSLSRLLGHSEISTTQRYLQTLTDEGLLDKAVASSPLMNLRGLRNE